MMYVIFIIDYIHYLLNESKLYIFVYNIGRKLYIFLKELD